MTKITRTIKMTTVDVMTVNTETTKVQQGTQLIPEFENIKKPDEYFRKLYDYGCIKYVTHTVLETNDITYACSLEDFLTVAKPFEK